MRGFLFPIALFAALVSGCSAVGGSPASTPSVTRSEARLYDASRNAAADVDAAMARAAISGKNVLLVMGANWCHDSLAFAGWTEQPRFREMIQQRYELVFVNVGMPQTNDGHNLDIAQRFGLKVVGTPTVMIIAPDGKLLNGDTAGSWRNAASRSETAIFDELVRYSVQK